MGVLSAISILLPLTFGMKPVAAILMLAGITYGAQYGGAICSILLNLPCHPPHAVTCLDGFPLTKQGRGGVGPRHHPSSPPCVAPHSGSCEMIFFAPIVAGMSPTSSGRPRSACLMLLGLIAGSTLAKGSPLKGVAMTILGLLLGLVGTDLTTGDGSVSPSAFVNLFDGIELVVAVARPVRDRRVSEEREQQRRPINTDLHEAAHARHATEQGGREAGGASDSARHDHRLALCDDSGHRADHRLLRLLFRGEEDRASDPSRFGHGAIEGVASPEASTHSAVQADFIPTMSLGIPGDAVMALLLGALVIQGITPGPRLIVEHPDIFWGSHRQLLDRQHHPRRVERADDRHLGEDAGDPLPIPLSERDLLRLHGRLSPRRTRSSTCC